MENLSIYNKYKKVPEEALKPFDNGKFKGTDINTMWRIKCLTEEFGPVGVGWYYDIVRTWTEPGANGDVFAFAEIALYVKINDLFSAPIRATGGNTIVKFNKKYKTNESSDEGFKMAITDALGVACKFLGIGADVYWENDRSKYQNESENENPKGGNIVRATNNQDKSPNPSNKKDEPDMRSPQRKIEDWVRAKNAKGERVWAETEQLIKDSYGKSTPSELTDSEADECYKKLLLLKGE